MFSGFLDKGVMYEPVPGDPNSLRILYGGMRKIPPK
jgi:hypothetical protein